MVWRDTPALRGGGFELLLDYNWILKVGGVAVVWPLGYFFFSYLNTFFQINFIVLFLSG